MNCFSLPLHPPYLTTVIRSLLDVFQIYRKQVEKKSFIPLQMVIRQKAADLGGHDAGLVDLAIEWLIGGDYLIEHWQLVGAELVHPDGRVEPYGPQSM